MTYDMKQGNVTPMIAKFSAPIILGNIFQQLYNTMDSIIVGRVEGEQALAAIGVANPIMSIAIFILFGICVGISILLAQLYGAEKYQEFQSEVSTSLLFGVLFTILLSIFFFFASKPILEMTQTPDEIIGPADAYLKIVSVGLLFTFFYNFYSGALRSMGDSKTPFLFLLISSVVNVVLDILFVAIMGMGVVGAAIATVIAQGISSILCIIYVYRGGSLLSLKLKQIKFYKSYFQKTVSYSWVAAMQQTFLYVGRLLVQSVVNGFGTSSIAAFNAAIRIEALAFTPVDGLSSSASTFFAQNTGAHQPKRIQQGFWSCLALAVAYSFFVAMLLFFIPHHIIWLFVEHSETEVIRIGALYLKQMSFFYLIGGCMYILQGFFRGIGKLFICFFSTLSQIIIRVVFAHILAPRFNISAVCYATVMGWIWMFLFEGILALWFFHKQKAAPK